MSDYRLYGGSEMTAGEVSPSADKMPIRDASLTGNARHRWIFISELQTLFGGGGGAGMVIISDTDPTLSDIDENTSVVWHNTTSDTVYNWANIDGVLYKSTVWEPIADSIFSADSSLITSDSTLYTADAA